MDLQLVTFEQAKALKELGFPQGGLRNAYYGPNGECVPINVCSPIDWELDAPTLELTAKWLREEMNFHIMIGTYDGRLVGYSETSYMYVLYHIKPIKCLKSNNVVYNTYEEALSAGIDKAIEILEKRE